jgi:hypothetical protein
MGHRELLEEGEAVLPPLPMFQLCDLVQVSLSFFILKQLNAQHVKLYADINSYRKN